MSPAPAFTDHSLIGPMRWCSHCIEITETVRELNQDCLSCTGCGKVLPLAVRNDCHASQTAVNLRISVLQDEITQQVALNFNEKVKCVQPVRSEINNKESKSLCKADVKEQKAEYYSEYDMEDRIVGWDDYETHETGDNDEY